jgi:hypothetical protein
MSRAVLLLIATGCGGGSSICSREWCGVEPTDDEVAACEEQIAPCTAADERLMNQYFDCVDESGGMCGTTETDGQAFATCATDLTGLSSDCLDAFVSQVPTGT